MRWTPLPPDHPGWKNIEDRRWQDGLADRDDSIWRDAWPEIQRYQRLMSEQAAEQYAQRTGVDPRPQAPPEAQPQPAARPIGPNLAEMRARLDELLAAQKKNK